MAEINKELIFNTLAYIEQHPEEWDQSTWFCDTTACFAGRALLLSGHRIINTGDELPVGAVDHEWLDTFEMVNEHGKLVSDIQTEAAEALGLPQGLASMIFGHHTRDPSLLRERVEEIVAEAEKLEEVEKA